MYDKDITDIPRNNKKIKLGECIFDAEIAENQNARKAGLSNRESMCKECGMLFVFEKPGNFSFWMKDMRFALDMVWILDTTIVGIDRDVLPPTVGRDIEVRQSPGLISAVLEVEAGGADSWAIGQTVSVSY